MKNPNKERKTAFIGLKIEPRYQEAYRRLPIKVRKEIAEAMRQAIITATTPYNSTICNNKENIPI